MKEAKTILFSTVEATLFYIASFYLIIDVLKLNDVLFWISFGLIAFAFSWLLSRRTYFWMSKHNNEWSRE